MLKTLKSFIKQSLFELCKGLESLSTLIQKKVLHQNLPQRRAELTRAIPVQKMDQDLLAMLIRWQGHQVEKSVRNKREPGTTHGQDAMLRLSAAVNEWHRREYAQRDFIHWAEDNLKDYERWLETNEPQLHHESELPIYNQQSPVWEVLTNRVSTRFWKPISVEDDKIAKILHAATYAPTSCNRQTWKFYVSKNRDLEQNSLDSGSCNSALRTKAPVGIHIMIDNRLYPEFFAPAEDAGIVGLQISLAATSLGLAGCLMYGVENFDQESFRKEFGIPSYCTMYLSYMFGYPAERTMTLKRAHPEDTAIFID